jgi:hypothetical protein
VVLNASPEAVFGGGGSVPRSSVLNRLLTWVLVREHRVELVPGDLDADAITGKRGGYQVPLPGAAEPRPFDDVLLRWGPQAPLGRTERASAPPWLTARDLLRRFDRLAEEWRKLYDEMRPDPTTSRAHWSERMFTADRLAPNFRTRTGLLVYSKTVVGKDATALENGAKSVLTSSEVLSALRGVVDGAAYDEAELKRKGLPRLTLEDALHDARALGRTIQALCDAPVAIFEASAELPSLMLLLGIRAVVRRGVTIVVRVGRLDPAVWQDLAFTLREVRLVPVAARGDDVFERDVSRAVVEGLRRLARRRFSYNDLPAFDAVRALGGAKEDSVPRTAGEEVIVVCPFDEAYSRTCWPELQRATRPPGAPLDSAGPARRVIDLQSPELVGRRLFEALRRDEECIADLSLNRPNVFFELGVRLAAKRAGARVVRCDVVPDAPTTEPPPWVVDDVRRIDAIVGTRSYAVQSTDDEITTTAADALALDAPWPGGTLSAGYAFDIAQRSVDLEHEAGGRSVEALLWQAVEDVAGRDPGRDPAPPVLYADNHAALQAQVQQFTFDALLAYVVCTRYLRPELRNAERRAIAVHELNDLVKDLDVTGDERARLATLVRQLSEEAT